METCCAKPVTVLAI